MSRLDALAAVLRRMGSRRADLVGINRRNVTLVYRHNARRDQGRTVARGTLVVLASPR